MDLGLSGRIESSALGIEDIQIKELKAKSVPNL
jgi:hypothetical protein